MALKPTDEPGKAGSDSPRRKVGKKSAEAGKSKAASSSKETTKVAATSAQRGGTKADQADRARVDEKTVKRIEALGESVVRQSLKLTDPFVDVPTRSISNVKFNKSKRLLEMGDAKQRRTLFNLGQAKKFMQTMLIADGCRDLVRAGKTLSLRGMYYKSLHTISGTKEKTFDGQDESDVVLEDLEVAIDSLRENLHVFAKKRGTMVGNITVFDNGDEINCRRMGTGGYAIPSICEPSVLKFGKCEAEFVLHVEKDTVWSRFNEDRFWETHNCILTEGSGQPPRGVRRLLHRLNAELGLPIYCLLDCDPWGHYIYSVIKQGSINLAYESGRMAVPEAKYLGIRSDDYQRCDLSDDVKIELNDRDCERAKQIAAYPWFADRRHWQKEIKQMLSNGFKMEVESLITKDISYVTETYVPERLKAKDWID
ncbi:MAG: DNA topoisomerase IV subunit A [Planctomycetota bacterium]|jgi:DNA topoisomerase VI subunit A|nr:DNA topoisomerase IV subunit A [Planctomycetota bacterium]MDA1024875.1 DNA topoisomerase IV subunit A [Planctomycetota bacterium]